MRTLAENFSSRSFGTTGDVVPIVIIKNLIHSLAKAHGPGFTNAAVASGCKRQFTVTTHTPMHSTKLPLWKWLQCMYFMVNSSKGISSVFMGQWIGVSQKTAWKMCHAIRELMDPGGEG
jgi:hypothetical protein